jgi:hypothetical protein
MKGPVSYSHESTTVPYPCFTGIESTFPYLISVRLILSHYLNLGLQRGQFSLDFVVCVCATRPAYHILLDTSVITVQRSTAR